MRDLVLVDSQTARVRVFREALAVYGARLRVSRKRPELRVRRDGFLAARKAVRGPRPTDEIRLHVFPSQAEALKFLKRQPPYEWAPRPAVVFADLYLEGSSGIAMVAKLKADRDLRDIPAVVLCSDATPGEVHEAWNAGSDAVLELPAELPAMLHRVADTLEFWLAESY